MVNSKPFTVDALLQLRTVPDRIPPVLSADDNMLSLTLKSHLNLPWVLPDGFTAEGVKEEFLICNVTVIDLASEEVKKPFPDAEMSLCAQWSPDGSKLAAYVQQQGFLCLGVWDRKTDTYQLFRELTVRPVFGFEVPRWTPDGNKIVIKKWDATNKQPSLELRNKLKDDAPSVLSHPSKTKTIPGNARSGSLVALDLAKGKHETLATNMRVNSWQISPNGQYVITMKLASPTTYDLLAFPLSGGDPLVIGREIEEDYGVCFSCSPDSTQVAVLSIGINRKGRLLTFPIDAENSSSQLTQQEELRFRGEEYDPPRWEKDSKHIWCMADGGIFRFNADGSRKKFYQPKWNCISISWMQRPLTSDMVLSDKGSVVCIGQNKDTKKIEFHNVDLDSETTELLNDISGTLIEPSFGIDVTSDGRKCYLIVDDSDKPLHIISLEDNFTSEQFVYSTLNNVQQYSLGKAQLIHCPKYNDTECTAALMTPATKVADKPLPLIVMLYPGAATPCTRRFGFCGFKFRNAHLYTSRNCAYLWPGVPLRQGNMMKQITDAVLSAVNKCVSDGIADPERLYLFGHSFGSYGVMSLITQTQIFKAAVASACISNLTLYGMLNRQGFADIEYYESGQAGCGGTIWEKRDAYIENSPFYFLDKVRTDLLLICGEDDELAVLHAEQTFSALRHLDQKVELRIYPKCGHSPEDWPEPFFRDVCNRVFDWFEI